MWPGRAHPGRNVSRMTNLLYKHDDTLPDLGQLSTRSVLRHSRRTGAAWIVALTCALIVAVAAATTVGAVAIPPGQVLHVLAHHLFGASLDGVAEPTRVIVWQVRLPRVVLGVVAGAGLAVAGVALQVVVRNVLADPYVLGVNSGASVGAACALLFGAGVGLGEYALQSSAFAGALIAAALVVTVARGAGQLTSNRLLMAGVAVGYALSAATSFLVFASDSAEGSRSVMFWLLGSLNLAAWNGPLAAATIAVCLGIIALWVLSRPLDALAVGDDTALSLGVSPTVMRGVLLVITSLLVGAVVAEAGSIGFVGLVVPHLARRMVGGRHAVVVPAAALLGATLMVVADVAARTVLAPQEIPIGVVTALVGTPLLLVLVRRMRSTAH